MTASMIDDDRYTVTHSVRIQAPRDLVFACLTEPSQIGQWFGDDATFPDGVHPGAEGTFGWRDHGEFPARIEDYSPTSAFAFTWGTPGQPIRDDNSTTARFTLSDDGDATVVTVVESGFEALASARAAMEDNAQGWSEEFADLRAHAEALAADPGTGLRPRPDLERGRITRSVRVGAPQDRVWDVLTDPEAIGEWWGHPADFPTGVHEGAAGTFEWVGHGHFPMRITRYDAPRHFEMLWGQLGDKDPGADASRVAFELVPTGDDETLLTVVEHDLPTGDSADARSRFESHVTGWTQVLDSLADFAVRAAR